MKHTLKGIFCVIFILISLLMSITAYAEPIVDMDRKGSITLTKTTVDGQTNVNNVEFSLVKIGDMRQLTHDEGGIEYTELYFSLNDVGNELFGDLEADFVCDDNTEVYSAKSLQLALNKATENLKLKNSSAGYETYYPDEFYAVNGGEIKRTEKGKISWTDLELGLYLIDETDTSGVQVEGITNPTVSATTGPFLVSVPRTEASSDNSQPNTNWEYDIAITAKNAITTEQASKTPIGEGTIVEEILPNGSIKYSANIGAAFTYAIRVEIVSTTNTSRYTEYVVTDTIDSGIDYQLNDEENQLKDVKISLVKVDDGGSEDRRTLTEEDYIIELKKEDENYPEKYSAFVIILTQTGLDKLNDDNFIITGSTYMEIVYGAFLNENARVDGSDNNNIAVIDYSHANTTIQEQAKAAVTVYTYALDITKLFAANAGDPLPDYSQVTFELADSTGRKMYGRWDSNEEQYIIDHYADSFSPGFLNIFSCIKKEKNNNSSYEGKVYIKGLAKDIYTLREISTAEGYSLLKEPVTVNIDGAEGTIYVGITNEKEAIFTLPLTGGSGTLVYTAVGLAFMFTGIVLFVILLRKKDN